MFLALLSGAVAGLIGFLPLFAGLQALRNHPTEGIGAVAAAGLGGVFSSFILLGAAIFLCSRIAPDFVLLFGLVEIFLFIIVSVSYFLWHNRQIRHSSDGAIKGE